MAAQLILWAVIGLLVDHFYQFQAHFIGQEANALNVLAKILLDQFVFSLSYCLYRHLVRAMRPPIVPKFGCSP